MSYANKSMRLGLAGVVAGATLALGFSAAAAPVTYERLLNAQQESHNWLLPYGSYSSHNHSNLTQINRSNVGDLRVQFLHTIGGLNMVDPVERTQSTPAVNDGFMYLFTTWGVVSKVDVRSGSRALPVWRNDGESEMGKRMRGTVALLDNFVFHNTGDRRLIKIDADSGETVWEVSTLMPVEEAFRVDQTASIQPIALKNQLLTASTLTVRRNELSSWDAETGELMWSFWTVPGPGEFGHETWADDWGAWKTGNAALWTQGSFDPETNLVIYGTGEPGNWRDPTSRPGDNLFTNAAIAINVDTGLLEWYFQEIPNESWDYDTVSPRMLYDIEIDGVTRKVQGNFSRDGYYYTLDRTNGDFLGAEAFTKVNWTAGLDPKTGLPVEYNPNKLIQDYAPMKAGRPGVPEASQNVCPNFYGAPTYFPPTYDAARMEATITNSEGCFSYDMDAPGGPRVDIDPPEEAGAPRSYPNNSREAIGRQLGQIASVDVRTGKKIAEAFTPYALYSGVLGTSGGLLFVGHPDGKFAAYDMDTLGEVWSFHNGTPISAPPISYMVDGKQYIAVAVGGQNLAGLANAPELGEYQLNSQVVVFGL
jgi:alcohol dehydrogenase (cytochrome c)